MTDSLDGPERLSTELASAAVHGGGGPDPVTRPRRRRVALWPGRAGEAAVLADTSAADITGPAASAAESGGGLAEAGDFAEASDGGESVRAGQGAAVLGGGPAEAPVGGDVAGGDVADWDAVGADAGGGHAPGEAVDGGGSAGSPDTGEPPDLAVGTVGDLPSSSHSHPAPAETAPAVEEPVSASVRPYTWTGGRTRSEVYLAIETLVSTNERGSDTSSLRRAEYRAVAELCREPRSVAEVAALLSLPLGVARVVLGDMTGLGLVVVHQTAGAPGGVPDLALMERVLSGLRRL